MFLLGGNPLFSLNQVVATVPGSLNFCRMSRLTIAVEEEAAHLVEEAARLAHQPLEHWLRDNIHQAALRFVASACTGAPPASRPCIPMPCSRHRTSMRRWMNSPARFDGAWIWSGSSELQILRGEFRSASAFSGVTF